MYFVNPAKIEQECKISTKPAATKIIEILLERLIEKKHKGSFSGH